MNGLLSGQWRTRTRTNAHLIGYFNNWLFTSSREIQKHDPATLHRIKSFPLSIRPRAHVCPVRSAWRRLLIKEEFSPWDWLVFLRRTLKSIVSNAAGASMHQNESFYAFVSMQTLHRDDLDQKYWFIWEDERISDSCGPMLPPDGHRQTHASSLTHLI